MVVAVVIVVPGTRVRAAFPSASVRRAGLAGAVMCALLAVLGGPAAYAVETVAVSHPGSQASAGPAVPRGMGGAGRGQRRGAGFDAEATPGAGGPGAGGPGGWGGRAAADPAVAALLRTAGTTWSAATATTMAAAGMELASGTSVMGIGGFSGSDPTPTLDRFQAYVTAGKIHYFVESAPRNYGRGGNAGPGSARGGRGARGAVIPIQTWVHAHYTGTPVGAQTVYDLTAPSH
jgi:hypothetical protein